jgi:chemotaxis methyl-accepting protein methylase
MPIRTLMKRFVQEDTRWRIRPEVAAPCRFEKFNLLGDPRGLGRFDVVFCRNVLIYFNRDLQDRAVGLFREALVHRGFLGLGSKESLQFVEGAAWNHYFFAVAQYVAAWQIANSQSVRVGCNEAQPLWFGRHQHAREGKALHV